MDFGDSFREVSPQKNYRPNDSTKNFSEKKSSLTIDPYADKKPLSIEELRAKLNSSREEKYLPTDFENDFVENEPQEKISSPEKLSKLEPIGQVALCYIVAQSGEDLYIVDQHAAHERILFDRFSGYADGVPAQRLLIHRILKFDSREYSLIENNLELFGKLGFTLEPSGENEFRLIEIPADAADSDAEDMLREIISGLPDVDSGAEIDDERRTDIARNIRQNCLATTACRAAIKSGMELNLRQMQILLNDLSNTPNPHTCPHGRPTIIKFSSGDLAKMFKRT